VPAFHLYLPQLRLSVDAIVERALAAEAAGFEGVAFMDHMAPPLADDQDYWEAMTLAAWVLARTTTLRVGHLVLCDSFRHPAVLARQAVTLDHASGGRFELGIGWGSVASEFATFGIGPTETTHRVTRLAETLDVLRLLWTGEAVDFDGAHFTLRAARQRPTPLTRIPLTIGGAGTRTLELVRAHADWWNVPVNQLDLLDDRKQLAGDARVSIQQLVALVPDESARADITATATRRFGGYGSLVIGTVDELRAHFAALEARGVERVYAWFTDFAPVDTLARFADVIG
jgi:alkanesulfonate monooxygenase SsuD/methylene tetrahydromethanopterin reductase-like flavin-dependent oxidoreductase (luciferase family)